MVTKEISVLIVDDDSGVAASIRLELKENYTVIYSASTIDEAREKITANQTQHCNFGCSSFHFGAGWFGIFE
jgi:DNA-binding NtrC family response regulator